MSVIINASSTSGLVISNDMSGTLQFQQNGVNLPMSGVAPAFGVYPGSGTPQNITSGSQQKVLFQVEEYDTNNNFASSRFTPTVPGYYQLNAAVRLDGSYGTGESMITIWKNGAEHKRGWNASGVAWATSFGSMCVSSLVYLIHIICNCSFILFFE